MGKLKYFAFAFLFFLFVVAARATIFGAVRGIVHDPQHRPVAGITVTLKAADSDLSRQAFTDENGEFHFDAIPIGDYFVSISQRSFEPVTLSITVLSGSAPVLHLELRLASLSQSVKVSGEVNPVIPESATPVSVVDRREIADTPGASRTNSLAMITDYVPGAYFTHDQLHVRGGHQVSWLVDGVPIPNTNIASNLGPQIDPKDIDTVETQRGSYAADYGDRTYGVFSVAPRTGFERDNGGELILGTGNFYQTDDQLNVGSHTERFAYYASVNGNRSNLGLQTPTANVFHDAENGVGGFGSLIFNANPQNQLRLVTSLRRDHYQVPFDPNDPLSHGLRDAESESDSYVNFSWVRTLSGGMLLTASPFYHFNRADYEGNPNDNPVAATDNRASTYAGGQATFSIVTGRHNARAGFYGFGQRDNQLLAVTGGATLSPTREELNGSLAAVFAEEQFKLTSWLTLNGGVRQTHFSGGVVEDSTSPRAGAALRIPKLEWVFRGFYGHFYQAPPLLTASGPLIQLATSQNSGFIPLHGERDEESQFGVTIPWKAWTLDADTFRTRADNFFDHNCIGNSGLCFPLTINGSLIRGWELTLHSPRIERRAQVYLTYSNQIAQGHGSANGGFTNFAPPNGRFLLDHDQRNTLNLGGSIDLPWQVLASSNVYYGSGFTDSGGPHHLRQHTTFDLTLAKSFGGKLTVSANALNVANRRVLLDNSQTFGGTHFLNPRELFVQIRYRFHY